MNAGRVMLRAVKPRYAEMILSGRKTLELFRVPPACFLPVRVLLYASGKGVVGSCVFHGREPIKFKTPPLFRGGKSGRKYRQIVRDQARRSGLDPKDMRAYVKGAASPTGFQVSDPRRFPRAVPLAELREYLGRGFFAPQAFRYLELQQAAMIETAANFGGDHA